MRTGTISLARSKARVPHPAPRPRRRRQARAPKPARFLFSLLFVGVIALVLAVLAGKIINFARDSYQPLKEAAVNAVRATSVRDMPAPSISAAEQADNRERLAMKQLLLASAEKIAQLSGDGQAKRIADFLSEESFLVKFQGDKTETLEATKKIEFMYFSGADTANFASWPVAELGEKNDMGLAWFRQEKRIGISIKRIVYVQNNWSHFFSGLIILHEGRHAIDADSGFTLTRGELRALELEMRIFLSFPDCRRAVERTRQKIMSEIKGERSRILALDFPFIYYNESELKILVKTCGPAVNADEIGYRSGSLWQYACCEIIEKYFPEKADSLKTVWVERYLLL